MMVFERVAAENGFAACARKLDVSPAAVTRLVGNLEDHLGGVRPRTSCAPTPDARRAQPA
jgi:DNA-binding transcriptional LysR family regulator